MSPLDNTLHFRTNMDPRRARDPRLARADPRMQQRPQSGSPLNAQPPPPPPSFPPQGAGSSMPSYPSASAPPPLAMPYSTTPASNQQLNEEAQDAAAMLQHPAPSTTPRPYKARPLFCVVCASNQVCDTHVPRAPAGAHCSSE